MATGRVLNKADPFFADEIGAELVCEVRKERVYITLFEGVRHAILIFEPYFCSDLTRLGDQLKSIVESHINGTTKHFKNKNKNKKTKNKKQKKRLASVEVFG